MKLLSRIGILCIAITIIAGQIIAQDLPPGFLPARPFTVEVINEYPHDPNAFTQGLIWYEGALYESTGQRGESTLREVDLTTGEVNRAIDVSRPAEELEGDDAPPNYFAEGLERVDNQLLQLTWTAGEAFVYDLETFEKTNTFEYASEGWGLCYDGRYLYMSDATQYLAVREPDTFELIGRMLVTLNGQAISPQLLNELECVGDSIYANLWGASPYARGFGSDFIVQIDKYTGNITGVIDAGNLLTPEMQAEMPGTTAEDGTFTVSSSAVLNGIAYNPDSDTFYITGKYWSRLFEVRFVPQN